MPGAVADTTLVGFYGKLPARGDFVRSGLPREFIDPWDRWLATVMADTRAELGDDVWLSAYLEAPIWRFALPPGLCGSRPVLGLTMPSVDKAGRYFPLTFAALPPSQDFESAAGGTWLDRCEDAGLAALRCDATPEAIAADLSSPTLHRAITPTHGSRWWTSGSVRLPANEISLPGLPDTRMFARMFGMAPDATVSVDAP
jgi:type VI secretion system protein ImpM